MARFVVLLPLLGHGLAHLSGVLAAWTRSEVGYTDAPWIFTRAVNLNAGIGRVFGLVWLLAMLGLVGAGLGIAYRQAWWVSAALAGSALSLLAIVPWWNTVPPGARVGAIFNLFLIALLLLPTKGWLLELVGGA